MELKEITNKHIGANGSKTTIILVGSGSEELERISEERLGRNKVYRLIGGKWKPGFKGTTPGYVYGLSTREHTLFNAHNHLEDGMEMMGYGKGTIIQQEYDYYYFDASSRRFRSIVFSDFNRHIVYARRKKAEKKAEFVVEVGKRYVRRDGKVTGYVERNAVAHEFNIGYAFRVRSPQHGEYKSYKACGMYSLELGVSDHDLVKEYIVPTININGYEVPQPVRDSLKTGDKYYFANPATLGAPDQHIWTGDSWDINVLNKGLIHLSKKAVKKHNKALRSFTILK